MKILLINNFHFRKGGSESVYFNSADLLKKHGHEVIFFSIARKDNEPCNEANYFASCSHGLSQISNYFYNSEAAHKLELLVQTEQPDIAHIHLFWGGLSPSILRVLHKYGIPIVHTAHDYRMICPAYTFRDGKGNVCERCRRNRFFECIIHRCSKGSLLHSILMAAEMYFRQLLFNPLKYIDGFVFVSQFSERKHIEHQPGFKFSNHIVLHNFTVPIVTQNDKSAGNYFLYFGRLSYEKGVRSLLKAFSKHPELSLKVVGSGPIAEDLKSEFGYAYPNIEFLGYYTGAALAELVQNAKFVCVPSEWYENNPMSIIESYSYGRPVIGANIGGIPEIVDDLKTGFLFESGNVKELEEIINRANDLSSKDYLTLCDNARILYSHGFSEEAYYEQLISFYNKVIHRDSAIS